ncbi:hypothetical protein PHLGIDRAFT_28046 [Phlebiopsis gigantea 11061_1 CR5-6]|uniref:DASH complex subunit ASK1 n=1 Tax=Phlebiopsis gigantea (strain 11061_1 CR5-6) TaxID=745531 RepID=A0A0C3PTZ9_PHLG1|nr:hypothetical protein PHLGIDRAFT_28046 [Phlebiopsis gigantea 11061_1 CR5-6]
MVATLKPIEAKQPRWEPSADPSTIVVPGLDTTASVNDQIEQIEQLITIKLQNVDTNFSKIQQVMANRILPAVKRYAVGTEPVREAAKFWTTFFEQAAQMRVPTYEEDDIENETQTEQSGSVSAEQHSHVEETEQDVTIPSQSFRADQTGSEASFMPGQAAVMSTPATIRQHSQHDTFLSQDGQIPSWSASLESPLVRLDRDLQSLTHEEVSIASSSILDSDQQESHYDESQDVTQRQIPSRIFEQTSQRNISTAQVDKGKGREASDSLRHNVLRRGLDASSDITHHATMVSPLKVKGKTPNLKKMNPYLSPGVKPSDWKGVVDLRDPTIATPRGKTPRANGRAAVQPSSKRSTTPKPSVGFELDDDLDATPGMSPPVTMAFAKLPGPTIPKLGRTPRKQAAERIMKNLLDVEKRLGAPKPSLSSVPTPPSLSRYNRNPYPAASSEISSSIADASLESMMKRVGLNVPASAASAATAVPQPPRRSPSPPMFDMRHLVDDELTDPNANNDSSSDSLDYDDPDASAAFLAAPSNMQYANDDSFSSDGSSDSMDGRGGGMQQFAVEDDGDAFDDEDSYDDPQYNTESTQEETLFGVPPAQRLARQAAQSRGSEGPLRMLGQELLEDTIGVGAQMQHVDETPTPWMR